jgi:glycosyltransferase involved in cell wall biosynthesis
MNGLYICYFGLREPLVQSQVIPYLVELAADGIDLTLLTFEPKNPVWSSTEREQWRERLRRLGIRWLSLRYHKFPSLPATVFDILVGSVATCYLAMKYRVDVIHARGHVPTAMALLARKLGLAALIFDIRGFMPEEYVDAGVWPAGGALYQITKVVERRLLAAADAFVVLTHRAREILFPDCSMTDPLGRPIEVIPCCVDMQKFGEATSDSRNTVRKRLNASGRRVLAYVGALGGWYLSKEMADFVALAHDRDPTVFALVLTQSTAQAKSFMSRLEQLGLSPSDYLVTTVASSEVPEHLAAADFAFCFIKPGYSKLSSSPTKIGEFLASGLPVLCNAGIGDIDDLLAMNKVGILVRKFDEESYIRVLNELEEMVAQTDLRQRCRAVAIRCFDLKSIGFARYRNIYARLTESSHLLAANKSNVRQQ